MSRTPSTWSSIAAHRPPAKTPEGRPRRFRDRFREFSHTAIAVVTASCTHADVRPYPLTQARRVRGRDRGVEGLREPPAPRPAARVMCPWRAPRVVDGRGLRPG